MKSKLEQAKAVVKKYKPLLQAAKLRAREGDTVAALEILTLLGDEAGELKALGYRLGDNGRVYRRTEEWALRQRAAHKELVCDSLIRTNPELKDHFEKAWKKTEREIYGDNL